jgi:hypothetical protein
VPETFEEFKFLMMCVMLGTALGFAGIWLATKGGSPERIVWSVGFSIGVIIALTIFGTSVFGGRG